MEGQLGKFRDCMSSSEGSGEASYTVGLWALYGEGPTLVQQGWASSLLKPGGKPALLM